MTAAAPAGDLTAWIGRLFSNPELLRMGHAQDARDLNLGLGWIYYGLARLARPLQAVVIGSWRGFVPLVIGRALADNGDGGRVTFIDPSLADGFWTDPDRVAAHFADHGVDNVRHFLATTQAFATTAEHAALTDIGLLFIDGYHTAAQARFDYEAFAGRLSPGALVLFHDSIGSRRSRIYGPDQDYDVTVSHYMDELRRDPALQLLDLPFGAGLTIMRRAV